MDPSIIIFIVILVLAFFLFTREVYPLEISAILILVLLVATGTLDAKHALSSFGNESLFLIGSLFILIAGLKKTGLVKRFEEVLIGICGESRNITFVIVLLLVAFLSAFVSNTATLAISIPIIVSMAKKFGDSPKLWLMPMAFASVLGGMNSLIGTSTNIIISSLLPEYNIQPFSLFTTANAGLPILFCGIIFLLLFSRYLLPKSSGTDEESIGVKYDIRPYTLELAVQEDSPLCNKSLAALPLFRDAGINVLGVIRADLPLLMPRGSLIIQGGDRLVIEGDITKVTEILDRQGLDFYEEQRDKESEDPSASKRDEYDLGFHEVLVTRRSLLNNRSPKEVYLRGRYRLSLIAINRQGATLREKLSDVRITAGDTLVVQFLDFVDNNTLDFLGLVPLQQLKQERYRVRKAPLAAMIFIGALLIGSATSFSLAVACLGGSVLMVMTGILRSNEIYEAVEWRVLIFIGGILCLGKGMESSGTAALMADYLSQFMIAIDPVGALAFFFIITSVMTQLLSNQATAVVMIPVAINTANTIGLDAMPFIMAVTIAASCCFVTPFEPAFMLVYGPGGYKFSDFFRLGIFLNVMAIAIAIYVIPRVWLL
ncbi:SLC13 family permease [Oligoflexia bacterium]|nr:SLC13 family permease [Oligoflexia bacterium]